MRRFIVLSLLLLLLTFSVSDAVQRTLGDGLGSGYLTGFIDQVQTYQNVLNPDPDGPDRIDAEYANDVLAAMVAVQTGLGVNPWGADADVTTRLTNITGVQYWVATATTALSAEKDLGALTTGLILNTVTAGVGVPSAYGGTSCTNQFPRSLNASGAATCATVALADTTGIAPSAAQYWVGAADGTLSAEKDLSGFTALVLNTTGTPSAYAGTSCTNQFPRSLSGSGAATCASVSLSADMTGTLGMTAGGTNASLTAAAGGLVYSTASALAIQAAGTSGYFARSGGTAAPSWFDLFGTANTWSAAQTISPNTNQLVLGTTNTTTITMATLTGVRVFTFPDANSNPVQPATCSGTDKISAVSSAGVLTCSTDVSAGAPTWDTIGNPTGAQALTMGANASTWTWNNTAGTFTSNFTSNFTTGSQWLIQQITGNPSGGVLFELKAADADVTVFKAGDGTNGISLTQAGALAVIGSGTIKANRTPCTGSDYLKADGTCAAPGSTSKATLFSSTINGGITNGRYLGIWMFNQSTEAPAYFTAPFTGTIKNAYFLTSTTQGATPSTLTLRVNGSNTSVVVTITGSGGAGWYSDTSNTASFTAGQNMSWLVGGANTATLIGWIMEIDAT